MPGKEGDQRGRPPTEASSRPKLRPPSDSDWAAVVYRFRIFRSFEDSKILERANAVPALLEEDAAAICAIADEVDRTGDTSTNIYKYRASEVIAQIEGKGHTHDEFWHHVRGSLVEHLTEPVKQSPSALRQRAYALRDASEDAKSTLGMYNGLVKRLRGKRGPPPSIAMYTLFETTDRWKVSILEIARQLDKAGVSDESDSDEPDPIKRWTDILERAQSRARDLRKTKGSG